MSILDTTTAIIGMSGAGKTVTAKSLVETLLSLSRHTVVIDPTGVWYGLRSNAAGDGPGFGIPIFGGLHGDAPITADDGVKVARLIIDGPLSAIVDVSELRSGVGQRRFMRDFMATIRTKPRTRFHLIFDEADEFAPQTVPDDIGYAMLEDMIWVAKRGRVHGFVPMLITQRPADISKAVLSQMQTLIIHQLIAPTDQAPVKAYLKGHATKEQASEVERSLASLGRGERWIYAPALGLMERGFSELPQTFDTSRTPEPGESVAVPATLASIDADALVAALKPVDTVADTAQEITENASAANELASRQAAEEIDRLKNELADAERTIDKHAWVLAGYQRAERAYATLIGDVLWPGVPRHDGSETTAPYVVQPLYTNPEQVPAGTGSPPPLTVPADQRPVAASPPSPPPVQTRAARPAPEGLTRAAGKMLAKLADNHPRPMTLAQLAKLTGVSTASSQWRANRLSFEGAPTVEAVGDRWRLSDTGIADLVDAGSLPENAYGQWAKVLPAYAVKILDALRSVDAAVHRDWIAETALISPTSSQLGAGLRELVENGLAEQVERGVYRATEAVRQ